MEGDADRFEQKQAGIVVGDCGVFLGTEKKGAPIRVDLAVEASEPGLRGRVIKLAGFGQKYGVRIGFRGLSTGRTGAGGWLDWRGGTGWRVLGAGSAAQAAGSKKSGQEPGR